MNRKDRFNVDLLLRTAADCGYSIEALCSRLGYSQRQIQRGVHKHFGCSLQRLIDHVRMGLALGLLRHGTGIKEVAYSLGYRRQSHFSRQFSAWYGAGPSAFVAGNARSIPPARIQKAIKKSFEFTKGTSGPPLPRNQPIWRTTRGRPARAVRLSLHDKERLDALLRMGTTPQTIARRARILLAMAKPLKSLQNLAKEESVSPQTIWNICRRYESRGLKAVWDAPRAGRPPQARAILRKNLNQNNQHWHTTACCDSH